MTTAGDLPARSPRPVARRLPLVPALALFAVWLITALWLLSHHAVWRDEVRALSLAVRGDTVFAMLRGLHGEGHPAVWYLLLRAVHDIVGQPVALQIGAVAVSAAAMLLLVLRTPLHWALLVAFVLGNIALFEYTVMARNYGISMLLMFAFAAAYPRVRDARLSGGLLLFLLANTNVHSVVLTVSFLLFWGGDLIAARGWRWTATLRNFLLNAVVALAGVIVCIVTVYPPVNDAAVGDVVANGAGVAAALALPATRFLTLLRFDLWAGIPLVGAATMSLVMFVAVAGLWRSPSALLAALTALFGLTLLFTVVYHGGLRHQALWLVFMMSLYWIVAARSQASKLGLLALGIMLALQLSVAAERVVTTLRGTDVPMSRSADFAAFMKSRPDLRDAVLVADPDYLLEPMHYYLPNATWFARERRIGTVVVFKHDARTALGLDEMLADAAALAHPGRPVLILLHQRLDLAAPPLRVTEGYGWLLETDPAAVGRFLSRTERLARFAPAETDESFDVYRFTG